MDNHKVISQKIFLKRCVDTR